MPKCQICQVREVEIEGTKRDSEEEISLCLECYNTQIPSSFQDDVTELTVMDGVRLRVTTNIRSGLITIEPLTDDNIQATYTQQNYNRFDVELFYKDK